MSRNRLAVGSFFASLRTLLIVAVIFLVGATLASALIGTIHETILNQPTKSMTIPVYGEWNYNIKTDLRAPVKLPYWLTGIVFLLFLCERVIPKAYSKSAGKDIGLMFRVAYVVLIVIAALIHWNVLNFPLTGFLVSTVELPMRWVDLMCLGVYASVPLAAVTFLWTFTSEYDRERAGVDREISTKTAMFQSDAKHALNEKNHLSSQLRQAENDNRGLQQDLQRAAATIKGLEIALQQRTEQTETLQLISADRDSTSQVTSVPAAINKVAEAASAVGRSEQS